MKRSFSIALALAMLLVLAACAGPSDAAQGDDSQPQQAQEPPASAEGPQEPDDAETPQETDETEGSSQGGGTLIAYFSWSGNTEGVAQIIAQQTGGDLFEIEPATPYTDDYDQLLDIARQEQSEGARPELAAQVEDWDSYDVVFLGYPNWWSDAPMAVYTFLEAYDFTGKTLIPFNTSSSGGFGRSLSGIEESAPGATVLEGLDLTERELEEAESSVTQWLSGLGIDG